MTLQYDEDTNGLKIIIDSNNEELLSSIKMLVEKNKPILDDKDGLTIPLTCKLKINLIDETISILF